MKILRGSSSKSENNMTTPTITPEERAAIRSEYSCHHEITRRLLDSLESAEAHIESLLPARELLVRANVAEASINQLTLSRNENQTRAEKAEAERDVLVSYLIDSHVGSGCVACPIVGCMVGLDTTSTACRKRVLEWAAQEAAEKKKDGE